MDADLYPYCQAYKRVHGRKAYVYTTNAIESLNNTMKKTIKNRASFPNDEAAIKLLYLSLKNIQKKWTMPVSLDTPYKGIIYFLSNSFLTAIPILSLR
jgi:transposase-like protein